MLVNQFFLYIDFFRLKVFAEQSPCNIQHFSSIQIHINGE